MPLETHQIARLRNVTTRSISPENFGGTEGGGGGATQGTGAVARPRPWGRLEDLPNR